MEAWPSPRRSSLVWPVGLARWGARWAALVAIAVALTVVSAGTSGSGIAPRAASRGATALARLESLPLQAQSVISSSLGTGTAEFAARRAGAGYRMHGGGVTARLGARAAVLGAGASSLRITSVAIGHGGGLRRLGAVSITAHTNHVIYDRGALSEWYSAGPLGIEQGFTVARRPAGAQSSLTVALGLGGSLRAKASGADIRFLARSGRVALRYGGLEATDARGRSLPATLSMHDGRVLLHVVDAGARYPIRIDPLVQPGSKLTPSDEDGAAYFGWSVALSTNGTTALIGGPYDDNYLGAAWVFTASGSSWTEQAKLVPSDETAPQESFFGTSVALSANGTTALIGGFGDASDNGAAWVYTGSGSSWTERAKLVAPTMGLDAEGEPNGDFGNSVALSGDGTTALIGGFGDTGNIGAAWVYTGSGSSWTEQSKLTAPTTGDDAEIGPGKFGNSLALSGAGTTALIGGYADNSNVGAAWVFTGAGSSWTEQTKLVPADETPAPEAVSPASKFGFDVALSVDGATAMIGGPLDNGGIGAAWVYTGSGSSWSEQAKLLAPQDTGSELLDAEVGDGYFGASLALASGGGSALIGAYANVPGTGADTGNGLGAAWLYTGSGSSWTETAEVTADQTTGPDGEIGDGDFGINLAMSSDGTTSLIAGETDNGNAGGVWTWAPDDGLEFSPSPLTFGTDASGQQVPLGSTVTKQLDTVNAGFLPRQLGALTVSGPNASSFSLSSDGCSGQTLGGAALGCSVNVSFSASVAGTYTAQLNVPDNSLESPHTVTLTAFAGNGAPTGITTPPGTGIIDGVVTQAGSPVPGATIYARQLEPASGGFGVAATPSDGGYFVADLPPGRYDVNADAPDGLTGYALVTVTAGNITAQDFALTPPPPLGDGVTVNGQGRGVPSFYESEPVTLGFPFDVPPTGTPDTTTMFTGFAGLNVFGGSADVSNIQYQAAMALVAVHYGSAGTITGVTDPVLAPVACGYSSGQSQACAAGAGIVSPAAAAATAQAIRAVLAHESARIGGHAPASPTPAATTTVADDDCPVVTKVETATSPPPPPAPAPGTITFTPNDLGGVDITYHYEDGTESTFVLAQAQIPPVSGDHPYANELINVLNAGLNVTAAGWWNAFVGAANALANAKTQSGAGFGQSITSSIWQVATQLISTKLGPIGKVSEEAIGTFFNWATGHFNSTILTPAATTTVNVTSQKIDCGSAYADPSGTVHSGGGVPLGKARVTLRRAATKTAQPSRVPNGSRIMSPANRRNPDDTNALGQYGWDVLPGFYDITATHAGCTAKRGRTALSPLLPVPPAQTGVNLFLKCPHLKRSAITIRLKVNRPSSRFSVYDLTARLLPRRHRAGPQGSVSFRAGSKLLGSVFLNPRSHKATFALPADARVGTRVTATYGGDDAYKPARAHVRLAKAR